MTRTGADGRGFVFRTRTTRRTRTCADFFIWIEKINPRSSACSASSACFFSLNKIRVNPLHQCHPCAITKVGGAFFMVGGAFFMAYSEKNPFSACRVRGKLYLYPHASRARGGAFPAQRNHVAKSRGVFAMCETVPRNRGKLSQRAKRCRETAGSFRNVRNVVAKPREAFATCETVPRKVPRNRGKLSRKEK